MYNDLDKKFDRITKKATPYLVLAPPKFRTEVAELMEALFHQLLQRSDSDFDLHYAQLTEMLDNRNSFESNLENRVWRFANMFVPMESTIYRMNEQMTELKKRVEVSEQKIKLLEKPAKNATTKAPVKAPVKNDTDVFYCEFCKTVKATKKGKKYSKTLGKIIQRYRCPKCGVWFKVDERGNSVDVKRNKVVVHRIERLKAEQQRTKPQPGTPSAPV